MPTYDYRCATCGIDFELLQAFSEDALKKCPTKRSGNTPAGCTSPGRGKVEKVFSAPGITFKGSGFYKTDSRDGAKKKATASASSSDGDSKGSDASSSPASDNGSKASDSGAKSSDSSAKSGSSDSGSNGSSSSTKTPSSSTPG